MYRPQTMRKLILLAALLNACDDAVVAPHDATLDVLDASDAVATYDAAEEPANAPAVADAGIDADR